MSDELKQEHPLLTEVRERTERIRAAAAEIETNGSPELKAAFERVQFIGKEAVKPAFESGLALLAPAAGKDDRTVALGWVMNRLAVEWPRLAREWLERGGTREADDYVVHECIEVYATVKWPDALQTSRAMVDAGRKLISLVNEAAADFVTGQLGGEGSEQDRTTLAAMLVNEAAQHTEEDEAKASTKKNPALRAAIEATHAEPKEGDANQFVLRWRVSFAVHWPKVLARWREENDSAPKRFLMPAALHAGEDSLGALFGGTKPGMPTISEGRFRINNGRSQADMFIEEEFEGTPDDLMAAFDKALGNRGFRALACCFYAATEDARTIECRNGPLHPGSFWFSDTRFADLMGFAREKNGEGTRQAKANRDAMASAVRGLGLVTFSGSVKVGGKAKKLTANGLIVADGVKIEDLGTKKGLGRKPKVLMHISPGLLMLLRGAAARYIVPLRALRPPPGVHQATWDDAFKVYAVLASYARYNPQTAKDSGRWVRTLPSLLVAANIATKNVPYRNVMHRLRTKILPALTEAGLLDFKLNADNISYALPDETGGKALATIPKKRLTASTKR